MLSSLTHTASEIPGEARGAGWRGAQELLPLKKGPGDQVKRRGVKEQMGEDGRGSVSEK